MSYPIWITPAGSLGTLPDSDFFQIQLDAYNPGGGALTYNFISGQLPPGIQLTRSGSLRGVPVVVGPLPGKNLKFDDTIYGYTVKEVVEVDNGPKVYILEKGRLDSDG